MKKIALFGPYPPPYGGRSIHIKRLAQRLYENNYTVDIYHNTKAKNENSISKIRRVKSIIFYIFKEKYDIIHFHDRNFKLISILIFFSKFFKYKTVLTYHSFRDNPVEYRFIEKLFFKYCIKRIDKFVCVGPSEYLKLCKYVNSNKIEVIQSYIQPFEDEHEFCVLPNSLKKFINRSNFLITANGNIRFYNDEDLYGLDMLIDLMDKLVNNNSYNIQLLVAVLGVEEQSEKEREYYNKLKKIIKNYSLENNIYLYEVKNTELYPLLRRSQLFIRPTNTDSYGVSIAEAIYAGIPAIASNVCERPTGTILFPSRNQEKLYLQVNKVFNNYLYYHEQVETIDQIDYFNDINHLYMHLSK
ncbi:glycosyltransferase [Priestia megaterium]|uniref:glycosyltransferase family 4 protein n=1 Tax=Priestia megaterium TaxID=1404 RepID=UPI000BF35498|nr:glycosyltransferase family 4 protein [Priestia megaterium]PET70545.1 glycosyltransferase [Priestia megaterium]PFK85981.1 glycosyltransferase [Priestia megaterium]